MLRFLTIPASAAVLLLVAGIARRQQAALPSPPVRQAPARHADTQRVVYPEKAGMAFTLPDGRREPLRSLLDIKRHMHFGDFEWNERGVPAGRLWIRVDLAAQTISVFRAGHEIGTAVILYGTDGHPTPTGGFTVREKDADHWSRSYDAPMPYMLRLTQDGVAIHASEVEQGYATHGCIGVPLAFARRLFEAAGVGDLVVIAEGAV